MKQSVVPGKHEGQRLRVISCAKMATLSTTANFMNNYVFFLVFTRKGADKHIKCMKMNKLQGKYLIVGL